MTNLGQFDLEMVMTFLDTFGTTFYSQIIHFLDLETTIKKILSIKISFFIPQQS
jgi:hypothetical protein